MRPPPPSPEGGSAGVDEMEERVRAASGSLLVVLSGLGTGVVSFLVLIFLTRHLPKTEFGIWTFVVSTAPFLYMFADLGVDSLVGYFLQRYRENDPARAWAAYRFGSRAKIFLLVVSVSGTLVLGFAVSPVFFWVALLMACLTPQTYLSMVLQSLQAFRFYAGLVVLESLLRLGLVGLFVGLQSQELGLLAMLYGAPYLLTSVLALPRARAPGRRAPFSEIREEAWRYGRWLFLSSMFVSFASYGQQLLLGYFRLFVDLADFGVAVSLSSVVVLLATSLPIGLSPSFLKKTDPENLRQSLNETTRYATLVSVFFFAFIYFNASVLVLRFFSASYAGASLNLVILSFSMLITTAITGMAPTALTLGRPDIRVKAVALGASVSLLGGWMLIPLHGALGASVSAGLGSVAKSILVAWLVYRLLKFSFPGWSLLRASGAALAAFLPLQWVVLPPIPHIFFQFFGGAGLYLLFLWMMRELKSRDWDVIVASLKAIIRI